MLYFPLFYRAHQVEFVVFCLFVAVWCRQECQLVQSLLVYCPWLPFTFELCDMNRLLDQGFPLVSIL